MSGGLFVLDFSDMALRSVKGCVGLGEQQFFRLWPKTTRSNDTGRATYIPDKQHHHGDGESKLQVYAKRQINKHDAAQHGRGCDEAVFNVFFLEESQPAVTLRMIPARLIVRTTSI